MIHQTKLGRFPSYFRKCRNSGHGKSRKIRKTDWFRLQRSSSLRNFMGSVVWILSYAEKQSPFQMVVFWRNKLLFARKPHTFPLMQWTLYLCVSFHARFTHVVIVEWKRRTLRLTSKEGKEKEKKRRYMTGIEPETHSFQVERNTHSTTRATMHT